MDIGVYPGLRVCVYFFFFVVGNCACACASSSGGAVYGVCGVCGVCGRVCGVCGRVCGRGGRGREIGELGIPEMGADMVRGGAELDC